MTPEQRDAWGIVLRHVLELLDGAQAAPAPAPQHQSDLSVAEAAERYHRQPSTIRGWCEAGRFQGAYRLRGREWRIPPAALAAFEEEQPRGRAGKSRPGRPVDLASWRTARRATP